MGKINFDIRKTVKGTLPSVPFEKVAQHILPTSYELSLVLIGDSLGARLNQEYKNKSTPTNVLSFPIASNTGEIFINVRRAKRDATKFGHTWRNHILFLFIHGCLHLRGDTHGPNMEKKEEALLSKFK